MEWKLTSLTSITSNRKQITMKKLYVKPQMAIVKIKAGTQMLAGSEQYNMYIIKGTKSGYTDDDDLDLEFVGGGHSGGRSRGTDDWDEEEW